MAKKRQGDDSDNILVDVPTMGFRLVPAMAFKAARVILVLLQTATLARPPVGVVWLIVLPARKVDKAVNLRVPP